MLRAKKILDLLDLIPFFSDPGHAQEAVVLAHHEALEEADAGAGGGQQEQADPPPV